MNMRYDEKTEFLIYQFTVNKENDSQGQFKVDRSAVQTVLRNHEIDYVSIIGQDYIDLPVEIKNEIFDIKYKSENVKYKGIYFPRSWPVEARNKFLEAYELGLPLFVVSKPGWECYPPEELEDAMYSEDGLSHVYYCGVSCGLTFKEAMFLESISANGGSGVSSFNSILRMDVIKSKSLF